MHYWDTVGNWLTITRILVKLKLAIKNESRRMSVAGECVIATEGASS